MASKNHPSFSSGRTVKARDLQYIPRPADVELLDHCKNGRPAYILHSPQMGKSSLIAHTAEQLNATAHHAVLIDLSQFPLPPREQQWFHNIVRILDDSLDLTTDILEWWEKPALFALPPHKRLTQLITEVILLEISGPLILFIDEIERTIPLTFRDQFFEWLSTLYESRATESILYRFSFVVCGVATPTQLIPDGGPQLFQWSHRVVLSDFTIQEALLLAEGLSLPTEAAHEVVNWVYRWTNGHPYLTQLLCQLLEGQHRTVWFEAEVDECIQNYIVSPQGLREPHFQFVRTALTEPGINGASLLLPYFDLLEDRVEDLKTNQLALEQLRLVGILSEDNEELTIRNDLYREVFSPEWAKWHLRPPVPETPLPIPQTAPAQAPSEPPRYVLAASIFLLGVGLLIWFLGFQGSPSVPVTTESASSNPNNTPPIQSVQLEASPTKDSEALTKAQEEIQELEATIARYQQVSGNENQRLLKERNQLETKLASKEEALSELQTELQTLTSEVGDQRDSYEESIATLQAERATLRSKATTTAEELSAALDEVKTLQLAVLKKSSLSPGEIQKLIAARSELGAQLKTANTELALAHERARNLDSLLSQHKQLNQTETERHAAEQQRLEATITALETSLSDNRELLVAKEKTAKEQAELARSELSRLQQDRAQYKALLSSNDEELSSLQSQIAKLESSITEKEGTIQEQQKNRDEYEERLSVNQETLAALKVEFRQLETDLTQKEQTIQEQQQDHTRLATELQDLRSQELLSANRMSQLKALLAQKSESTESTLASLEKERNQLQTALSQTNRELNSAKTQVTTLGDQLSSAMSQVAFNQTSLQDIHASSSEQARRSEEQVNKLISARSTLEIQLEESRAALTQAQEKIAALETKSAGITAAEDTLKIATKERDQFAKKLQNQEIQLAKAQKQIQGLKESLRAGSSKTPKPGNSFSSSLAGKTPSSQTESLVNVIARITDTLSRAPNATKADDSQLLFARQAFLYSTRSGGQDWATIDRSLREGLRSSPIELKGVPGKIHTLTFDPAGDQLIAGTSKGTIAVWTMNKPLNAPQLFTGHTAGVLSVTVSPNGQHMASGSLDSTIRLWNLTEPASSPRVLQSHTKGATSVAFRPDGKELATGSQDHSIRLWDVTSPQPKATVLGTHSGRVNAVAYTPNGKTLLSGGDDLTLRIWDLERQDSPPRISRGHRKSISTISVHPSGTIAATGSRDSQIGLWNLRQSFSKPTFLTGSRGRIAQVRFGTDGSSVVSVGSDKSLRIWNWQDPAQKPIQLPGQKGALAALSISPDGRTIAVAGSSKKVRLWSSTEHLASAVCDTAKENLPYSEWKQVVGETVPYERTCPNLPLHPSFLEEGRRLAKQGSRKKAQTLFEQAKQMDPYLELDPKKEAERLSAKSS